MKLAKEGEDPMPAFRRSRIGFALAPKWASVREGL